MVWMLYSVFKRYVLIYNLLLGQDSIYEEDLIQINLQILTVFNFAIFFVDTIFAIQFYKREQEVNKNLCRGGVSGQHVSLPS